MVCSRDRIGVASELVVGAILDVTGPVRPVSKRTRFVSVLKLGVHRKRAQAERSKPYRPLPTLYYPRLGARLFGTAGHVSETPHIHSP